jgi:hypothetical protein
MYAYAAIIAGAVAQSAMQKKAKANHEWAATQIHIMPRYCNYCRQHTPGETCKQCGAPRD